MTSKRNRRLNGCSGRISLFKTKETGRKQMELPVNQKLGCRPWFYIEDPYNLPSGGYPMSLCLNSGFGTACTWIWYMVYWIEDSLLIQRCLYNFTTSQFWVMELQLYWIKDRLLTPFLICSKWSTRSSVTQRWYSDITNSQFWFKNCI